MRLTVRVPASTANLGSGFDCVGLAVDWFDELTLEVSKTGGIQIEVFGEGSHQVPRDESHLVIATLLHALRQWGVVPPGGLLLRTRNTIPHSRGLGSSAAAIVAGCALAELTRVSSLLEGHPDNAGAAVWGGAILAWLDGERVELIRLRLAEGLRCLAFVPDLEVRTEGARAVLPDMVPRKDAVAQAIAAASLPLALEQRPDLLLSATRDRLHQFQRAELMPASWSLLRRLRRVGVPATISGAGPTVFAIGLEDQLAKADSLEHEGFQRHDLVPAGGVQLVD